MANRFWVGGGSSTNWNATVNTNWAATSGGANNQSVPTTADDVFFDANSGVGNSVISAAITIKSLDCTGYAGTITHNAFTLTVSGNLFKLVAGMTYTPSATTSLVTFTATSGTTLLTSAAKLFGAMTLNGSGSTLQLQDALFVTAFSLSALTVTAGVFDANNFAVNLGAFTSANSNVRTVTMGSQDWTLSGTGTVWSMILTTNLTFNKNTANIVLSGTTNLQRNFNYGSLTYNNLTINSNTSSGLTTLAGSGSFANVTATAPNNIAVSSASTLTTAALSLAGSSGSEIGLRCGTEGSTGTVSVASGAPTITWAAIKDTAFAGGATFAATSSFDLGNNTGITITAPSAGGSTGFPASRIQLGM